MIGGIASATAFSIASSASAAQPFRFGLTPVFLDNDADLLSQLGMYLSKACQRDIAFVQRRTYEEITALLVSGSVDAAWICGYPFVTHAEDLSLLCVPLWQGQPLYQSYLIVGQDRLIKNVLDLRGDVHAFSDPNSNSGYLVTAALLAEHKLRPGEFFRQTIFTYGHRNVVRAVASGLAQSGSVDGYVWEVLNEVEPALAQRTRVLRKSELLGFPPIAVPRKQRGSPDVQRLHDALLAMSTEPKGRAVLRMLRLDGFEDQDAALFAPLLKKIDSIKALG